MKITKEKELARLRHKFYFSSDGTAILEDYGEFKRGVTSQEIEDYLKVRANNVNIKSLLKKFNENFGCQTCAMVIVNNTPVTLFYRWDVIRCANDTLRGVEHIPLD